MTASASPSESRPKPLSLRSENSADAAADRRVTIVIPTFNEAANIPELLRRISAAVPPGQEISVLFVDDSTDNTPETIEKEAVRLPIEVCVHHRGQGEVDEPVHTAVRQGGLGALPGQHVHAGALPARLDQGQHLTASWHGRSMARGPVPGVPPSG